MKSNTKKIPSIDALDNLSFKQCALLIYNEIIELETKGATQNGEN